jgi:hypothetical protein
MRRFTAQRITAAAALAAAVGGVTLLTGGASTAQPVNQQPQTSQAKPPAQPGEPATAPAAQEVPVKVVVLFSSGVGYFEHFGTVKGDGSTELRFKTQQINDILKSLVLQDMDGGKVAAVTYPSQDPVAKTLRSFQVDITSNPSLAELLNQLRGAKVTVTAGTDEVAGVVVGVEKKQRPVGKGDDGKLAEVAVLNLLTEGGIRSVQLDEVRNLKIDDPQLREELQRALTALSQARDQDKKPVTVNFRGQGERRVRLGYVVEAPVWKTSYRLILSDAGDEKKEGAATQGTEPGRAGPIGAARPGSPPRADDGGPGSLPGANDATAQSPLPGDGRLQGWAIIENQTDSDWSDVQLSLVSGRPISFIQDLYQPLYIPRPVVKPELYASLRPQTYDAGMTVAGAAPEAFMQRAGAAGMPPAPAAEPAARMRTQSLARRAGRGTADMGVAAEEAESLSAAIDPSASVASVASAAKVGELFQYTVGNVNLPRQKSAMIPVVTDQVQVERLSIYNQSVLPRNPLTGARVRNTTGKHLLQGPVTVLDAGAYAGDARIDDVPPGQERLLSYGVDQQVIVDATKNREDSAIQTGRIVKGVLEISTKQVFTQEYLSENKSERDKTLVIEHPVRQGWKLVEPAKADETTEAVYRFKGRVGAGKRSKLAVKQEIVTGQRIAILPSDVGQLQFYSRTGEIPKEVRDALVKAIGMKHGMTDTQRQIEQRQQRVNEISTEQSRIRENLKTVAANSEYSTRLLKKLDEQETQIEALQKEIAGLRQKLQDQQRGLEEYLAGLNVG